MELKTEDSPVILKTLELCQTLLDQPTFHEMRAHVDAFSEDQEARQQYNRVYEMQEAIQSATAAPSQEEMDAFECERKALFTNEVVRNFTETQQALHKLQETITSYIANTFRLGRLPEKNDFAAGSCGPQCRCGGK